MTKGGGGKGSRLVLLLTIALLVGAMLRLFLIRFEAGDVFPPYSSLRSDPLGCRALYESLGEMEGLEVVRNHKPVSRIVQPVGATLFYLGADLAPPPGGSGRFPDDLGSFVAQGGRLVIAFAPINSESMMDRIDRRIEEEKQAKEKKTEEDTEEPSTEEPSAEKEDKKATPDCPTPVVRREGFG